MRPGPDGSSRAPRVPNVLEENQPKMSTRTSADAEAPGARRIESSPSQPGAEDRRVGDELTRLEVEDRGRRLALALAERLEVADRTGIDDGDVDGDGEHVVVGAVAVAVGEPLEAGLADDGHVEQAVAAVGRERLAAEWRHVERRLAGVEDANRGDGVVFAARPDRLTRGFDGAPRARRQREPDDRGGRDEGGGDGRTRHGTEDSWGPAHGRGS